jgi:hypothetical protein
MAGLLVVGCIKNQESLPIIRAAATAMPAQKTAFRDTPGKRLGAVEATWVRVFSPVLSTGMKRYPIACDNRLFMTAPLFCIIVCLDKNYCGPEEKSNIHI